MAYAQRSAIWTILVKLLSTNSGVSIILSTLAHRVPWEWNLRISVVIFLATVSLLSSISKP